MTSLRMAWTELRRLTSGRMPRLAVIAIALIPTLYAGLYLYANHDPYAGMNRVPAALVINDEGATLPTGKEVNVGKQVGAELLAKRQFGWQKVSAAEATAGVRDGTFDFALVIPSGFSASLASTTHFAPEEARFTMITNDANSYLSTTIADRVQSGVVEAIRRQVGEQAATQFLLGFNDIRSSLTTAADGADQLAAGLDQANAGGQQLHDGTAKLQQGLGKLTDATAAMPEQTRKLADGAAQVAAGNQKVANLGRDIAAFADYLTNGYDAGRDKLIARMQQLGLTESQQQQLLAIFDDVATNVHGSDQKIHTASAELDRLADGANQVAAGNRRLADASPKLVVGIKQAHDGAGQLNDGAAKLQSGLDKLAPGATQLATGLRGGLDQIPATDNELRDRVANTIANPVQVTSHSQASAGSYGAGLAPFFMALAAWIGGYVLFLLVRPLSNRALATNQTPLRIAVGGWLAPALIGVVQVLVMLAVLLFGIDLKTAHVPTTFLFLMLVSANFVAIVHCLNAWFGAPGQFLGLALMVLQLVTSGGTFPWQTIPTPLHVIHHLLPMSYALDGLRQLMYGGLGALAWRDVVVLLGYLVGALLLTAVAARKQRVWTMKRIKPELSL